MPLTGQAHVEYKRQWRAQNRDRVNAYMRPRRRGYLLKFHYGITEEDYQVLLERQNHCCAICGTEDWTQQHGRLHVDHDHATLHVRGLLCLACNMGLGAFRDQPELLEEAARYLSKGIL